MPPGYLYCDGSDVSRQAYDKLFAAIGTTWGEGDGVETFNIPDLRGVFVRCDGGENNAEIGVRQEDAIRNISGGFGAVASTNAVAYANGCFSASQHASNAPNSGSAPWVNLGFSASNVVPTAPEVRPVNVAMKYCIRYE